MYLHWLENSTSFVHYDGQEKREREREREREGKKKTKRKHEI